MGYGSEVAAEERESDLTSQSGDVLMEDAFSRQRRLVAPQVDGPRLSVNRALLYPAFASLPLPLALCIVKITLLY